MNVPSFTAELIESTTDDALQAQHHRAYLYFNDWMDRPCRLYAEALIPQGDSIAGIVHSVGGAQTISYGDLQFWAEQGIACASFDWQIGEFPNRPEEKSSRWPEVVNVQYEDTKGLENCIIPLAIQSGRCVISWLSEMESVDPKRMGLSGISWGGYLTWAIAAYDDRIKAIVPVYGSGIFGQNSEARKKKFGEELQKHWANNWDPQALAQKQTAPACYLTASNDFFGNIIEANELLGKMSVEAVCSILPNCDHSLGPGESALASSWMQYHLNGGPALPKPPTLNPDLTVDIDESLPVEKHEIWWTANEGLPRFACWHCGKPQAESYRLAYARVTYKNGISLCSRLYKNTTDIIEPIKLPTTWPDIKNGIGWKWQLGNTQHYNNSVNIKPINGGEKIEVTPVERIPDYGLGFLLQQVKDPAWNLTHRETIELEFQQEGNTPDLTVAFYTEEEPNGKEVVCSRNNTTYSIALPENLTWQDIRGILVTVSTPRAKSFILGPLRVIET